MHNWFSVALACAVLSVSAKISAAATPPVPDNPQLAETSLGFNPKNRCPDLRIADEGTLTVVVFWVPRSGIPSQISIKSSSGSDALDTAAVNCVSKLRFAPATRLGDGEPIDSWQQIAWRWADRGSPASGRSTEPTLAPKGIPGEGKQNDSHAQANMVTVHVCVDEKGKLKQDPTVVHSSGNAALDEAAVKIAASGSAYYRPGAPSDGAPLSGCAQLAVKFESQ